ncbi:hypothetical protein N2152v2_005259 [Parachlorella kessleri]
MVMVNPRLVGEGEETLNVVKGYIRRVVGAANTTVAHVQSLDGVLLTIQGIVNTDINETDIVASLQGIRPWLASLPDPAGIKSTLLGIQAALDSQLTPALAGLQMALGGLIASLPSYAGALQNVVDGEAFLGTVMQQADDFHTAAYALPASQPAPPADANAVAAASTALDAFVGDIDSKIAQMTQMRAALVTLQTALLTDRFVERSYDALTTIQAVSTQLLGTTVPGITSLLHNVQAQYDVAAPHLGALLVRARHINNTVLVLPDDLQDIVSLLRETQASLDDIMQGPNSPGSIATNLNSATAGFAMPASITAALQQLSTTKTQMQGIPDPTPFVSSATTAITQLQSTKGGLLSLQAAVAAALATSPVASYGTLRTNLLAAADGLQTALAPAASIKAQGASSGLFTTLSMVGSVGTALAGVPSPGSYTPVLDDMVARFAALPSPASRLVDDAQQSVHSIIGEISNELDDAHRQIVQGVSDAQSKIHDADEQTLGNIAKYEGDYLPLVYTYDKWRQVGLYCFLALGMLLATLLWAAAMLNWPAPLKATTFVLLLLLALYWLLVVVFTAVLKVGNDGCTNIEAQVISRVSGSSMGDKQKILTIAEYYLYDMGGPVEQVIYDALGLNITDIKATVESKRAEVLQQISGQYQLQPLLNDQLELAVDISDRIIDSVMVDILGLISYGSVHQVYTAVKSFGCCTALNLVGGLWVGLVVMGSCSLMMCVLALVSMRAMDKLPKHKGCCHRFKYSEFLADPSGLPKATGPMVPPSKGGKGLAAPGQQFLAAVGSPVGYPYAAVPASPMAGSHWGSPIYGSPPARQGSLIAAYTPPASPPLLPAAVAADRTQLRSELLSPPLKGGTTKVMPLSERGGLGTPPGSLFYLLRERH